MEVTRTEYRETKFKSWIKSNTQIGIQLNWSELAINQTGKLIRAVLKEGSQHSNYQLANGVMSDVNCTYPLKVNNTINLEFREESEKNYIIWRCVLEMKR